MCLQRIYFGNWLRDYSQAIDIASLKKTDVQTCVLSPLSFSATLPQAPSPLLEARRKDLII
jgi:hypothetical protein